MLHMPSVQIWISESVGHRDSFVSFVNVNDFLNEPINLWNLNAASKELLWQCDSIGIWGTLPMILEDDSVRKVFSTCISYGLEFAFHKKVLLKGKTFKLWSQAALGCDVQMV